MWQVLSTVSHSILLWLPATLAPPQAKTTRWATRHRHAQNVIVESTNRLTLDMGNPSFPSGTLHWGQYHHTVLKSCLNFLLSVVWRTPNCLFCSAKHASGCINCWWGCNVHLPSAKTSGRVFLFHNHITSASSRIWNALTLFTLDIVHMHVYRLYIQYATPAVACDFWNEGMVGWQPAYCRLWCHWIYIFHFWLSLSLSRSRAHAHKLFLHLNKICTSTCNLCATTESKSHLFP